MYFYVYFNNMRGYFLIYFLLKEGAALGHPKNAKLGYGRLPAP